MAYEKALRHLARAARLASVDDPRAFAALTAAAEEDEIEKVAIDLENEADDAEAMDPTVPDELPADDLDEELPPEEVAAELRSIRRQIKAELKSGELTRADADELEEQVEVLEAQVEEQAGHTIEKPEDNMPPLDPPTTQTVPSIKDVKARLNAIASKAQGAGYRAQASRIRRLATQLK